MRRILIILALFVFTFQFLGAQTVIKNDDLSNASEDQLAPVPYLHNGDTGIVFMSNIIRPGTRRPRLKIIAPGTMASGRTTAPSKSPMDLYFYDQAESKGVKKITLLDPGGKFYTIGDDGPATFSGDFTKMCIVQPQRNAAGELVNSGFGGLFLSEWVDGEWSDPEPFPHNDPAINFSTPCMSADGQLLFFAAEGDLDGAVGGMDIYYSMHMNNSWSAPVSMGDRINTPEHEIFPFYYLLGDPGNPNIRLYFSSKGHNARAGTFDLFYSVFYDGEWLEPLQVPSLNTDAYDELGIYLTNNINEGMFSRREGNNFNIYNITPGVISYESFPGAGPMKKTSLCYRIYENSIDTIDPVVFDYEWVIEFTNNDTLRLPGHDVKYCFPGPGEYSLSFNVTNKLTDTTIYNAAHLALTIPEYIQPIISATDTAVVGEPVYFSAAKSNLPEDWDRFVYFWDYGDGSDQEKGENVRHPYTDPGKYTVTLGAKKVLNRSEERMLRNNELPESEYKIAVVRDIIILPE